MEKRIQDSLKDPEVMLRFIGLGEDDLRWFIPQTSHTHMCFNPAASKA